MLRRAIPKLISLHVCLENRAITSKLRSFASSTNSSKFKCSGCGQTYSKWRGQCTTCLEWNVLEEINNVATTKRRGWTSNSKPIRVGNVSLSASTERIQLSDVEINWVFGGGIVPGSLTLVAGAPGVGKSTLSLQIAHMMATACHEDGSILYVSGEESVSQVKMRSDRLAMQSKQLYLASETNIESIVQTVQTWDEEKPCRGLIIDSIQTMYTPEINSTAGNVNQVKECTLRLLAISKELNIPVILIGHVTKSGDIAGPKVLEHIVDTVVQLDGEVHSSSRFLRCIKNRFGTTSEVGVLSMTDAGLFPLSNPLHAFLSSENDELDGVAVTIAVEGSRPIPVEIQTLTNSSYDGYTNSRCHGVPYDKLQLILAILERRARVSFRSKSVFVNIAQGYSLEEPCADLALAIALASSATQRPVIANAIFMGELALSGKIRPLMKMEPRLGAARKIGIETAIVPKALCAESAKVLDKYSSHMKIHQVDTLVEALSIGLLKEEEVNVN